MVLFAGCFPTAKQIQIDNHKYIMMKTELIDRLIKSQEYKNIADEQENLATKITYLDSAIFQLDTAKVLSNQLVTLEEKYNKLNHKKLLRRAARVGLKPREQ